MTLNQIIKEIRGYFELHILVNTANVTIGDDDLNAINNIIYPLVNIQYLDTDVTDKRMQHNFKIIIGDLTNPNVLGIDFEIYSDCIQIAGDFFSWMEDNYKLDWIRSTNIQPFQDDNGDRISGIVFTIGVITFIGTNISCN